MRQNRTKKAGNAVISAQDGAKVPKIPNPDDRVWHALTTAAWRHAWQSPMATQWLDSDVDALGRLALLWDEFYKEPQAKVLAEIRLQESRFGLSPLDRSRLQWEVSRGEEAEQKQQRRRVSTVARTGTDPRVLLMPVP